MTKSADPMQKSPSFSEPQSPEGEIVLDLFGRTDVGQIREHNEDNFLIADLTRGSRSLHQADRQVVLGPRGHVLGVCDGMGGAAAGEIASQIAVDTIFEHMSATDEPVRNHDDLARRLVRAVEVAGARIFNEAKLDRARRGMGTTSTIAALLDDHLFLAQVGDSRAYVLRGDKLVQVTRDQSLVNQLIEAGQLTEEEAETFEHNNIILQALGTSETVDVDLTYVHLRRGDRLMLCSDGLSGMVRFEEIREVLRTADPLEACKRLTDMANEAGGHDNITVVVASFDGPGLLSASPDDDLRYRKYALPEPGVADDPERRRITVRDLGRRERRDEDSTPSESLGRVTDHGPSRSKLANTIVGESIGESLAQILSSAEASEPAPAPLPTPAESAPVSVPEPSSSGPISEDDYTLPTVKTPWWMLALLTAGAIGLAALVGSYLLGP